MSHTTTESTPCSVPNSCDPEGLCLNHETEQAHNDGEHTMCGEDCIETVRAGREFVYRERAHALALALTIAKHAPGLDIQAVITPATDIKDEPGWHLLFVYLGEQQLSWHIAPEDVALFAGEEYVEAGADDSRIRWDGHTTTAKYDLLTAFLQNTSDAQVQAVRLTVDVLIVRADGKIAIIKRGWWPDEGKWAIPGGHINPGERPIEAAVREVWEETGVPLDGSSSIRAVGLADTPGRDPRGPYVSIVHVAHVPAGTELTAGSDARTAGWFSLDELPKDEDMAFDHGAIINSAMPFLTPEVTA